MTDKKDIGSRTIYDRSGNVLGNITGRKEDIERFSNHDLAKQIEIDRSRQRENLRK